jgi:hypothetical protein
MQSDKNSNLESFAKQKKKKTTIKRIRMKYIRKKN